MLRSVRNPTLPIIRPLGRQHGYPPSPSRRRFTFFDNHTRSLPFLSARRVLRIFKYIVGVAIVALLWFLYYWQIHVEIMFYSRSWVHQEVIRTKPLAGCFRPDRIKADGGLYNLTEARAPKRVTLHPGVQMRLGMDCYDFAGTIAPPPNNSLPKTQLPRNKRTNYHTYWRADLAYFGERQAYMLKSFFATQDVYSSTLILWSNGDLASNKYISPFLASYPDAFELKIADIPSLAKGTTLDNSIRLKSKDKKAWVDGDLVRLLVLWFYGGLWIDMDMLLTRDLAPLLEHEFVSEWDCYNKIYQPMNGALMHFQKHSPYLCEAFHIMNTSTPPRPDSTDWGSLLYYKLWRRLVAESIPPFQILPFCFSDGRSCRMDNRIPDPFVPDGGTWAKGLSLTEGGDLDSVLGKVFAVHLHNQWNKKFPPNGWVERLLLKKYDSMVHM